MNLSLRITRSGGVIWQSARIKSWYSPRPSLTHCGGNIRSTDIGKYVSSKSTNPCFVADLIPGAWLASLFLAAGAFAVQQSGCLASGDSRRVLSVGQSGSNVMDRPAPSARQIPSYSASHLRLLSPGYGYGFCAVH